MRNSAESLVTAIVPAFIAFVFALLLLAFAATLPNVKSSIFNRYDLVGTVDSPIGTKFTVSENSGTSKASFALQTAADKVIVNCNSTQCFSLQEGEHVVLSCYDEWHPFQPYEIECRFKSL